MTTGPTSRRTVLKRSALTALALGIGGSASGAASRSSPEIEQFRVEGTRETTVRYEPETITVTVRKRSPSLSDRLESQRDELVDEIEYDRTALNESKFDDDLFPERGQRVDEAPWTTHIAREAEWRELFAAQSENYGPEDSHLPSESDYDHAVWTYSDIDETGYERRNPINIVCDLSSRSFGDVQDVLTDDGWSFLDWDALPPHEYRRFAWNQELEQFEDSHASLGYAWTFGDPNIYGANGRYHVQTWEFVDGLVGVHCHEDTPVPHSVESYTTAEDEVRTIFASAGWETSANELDLPNAYDDHNGLATRVRD